MIIRRKRGQPKFFVDLKLENSS